MARRYKKQFGGLLSNFFGGMGNGQGNDFVSQIGSALQGFSNEPALSSVFSQSEKLFEGFSNQLSDGQREQMGDVDKMKPVFDLFSLFSNGLMGRGFQDGGQVKMSDAKISEVKKRFGEFQKGLVEGIAEAGAEQNKVIAKARFNQQYAQDSTNINQIIPGMKGKLPSSQPQMQGRQMQGGGAIPVSSRGQFDFPGQPVIVPTPDGSITMNGVNQDILAVQNGGVTVLPANSGVHQFAPGQVLEIPLNKTRKKKSSRIGNSSKNGGESTTPKRTSTRYNRRNNRTQQRNKRGNVGLPFGTKVGY